MAMVKVKSLAPAGDSGLKFRCACNCNAVSIIISRSIRKVKVKWVISFFILFLRLMMNSWAITLEMIVRNTAVLRDHGILF